MSERIRKIQEQVRHVVQEKLKSSAGDVQAACIYIPLFGWLYSFFLKKDKEHLLSHRKQSVQLNLLIISLYCLIWLLESFPISTWVFGPGHILHPLSRTIWLLGLFSFLIASGTCAYQAFLGRFWPVPYLAKIIGMCTQFLKNLREALSTNKNAE